MGHDRREKRDLDYLACPDNRISRRLCGGDYHGDGKVFQPGHTHPEAVDWPLGLLPGREPKGAYLWNTEAEARTAVPVPIDGNARCSSGKIQKYHGRPWGQYQALWQGKGWNQGGGRETGRKELFQNMSANFGYSLIFLQIAIVMSLLAAITKKKPLWYLGLATATGRIFYFSNAFLLFY